MGQEALGVFSIRVSPWQRPPAGERAAFDVLPSLAFGRTWKAWASDRATFQNTKSGEGGCDSGLLVKTGLGHRSRDVTQSAMRERAGTSCQWLSEWAAGGLPCQQLPAAGASGGKFIGTVKVSIPIILNNIYYITSQSLNITCYIAF